MTSDPDEVKFYARYAEQIAMDRQDMAEQNTLQENILIGSEVTKRLDEQDELLIRPQTQHSCTMHSNGARWGMDKCLACAYEEGAKTQLAKAQLAIVQKHRLDRPELREKIAFELYACFYRPDKRHHPIYDEVHLWWKGELKIVKDKYYKIAGKILALIPDCEGCADGFISTHEKATSTLQAKLEQAKKEERERIIKEVESRDFKGMVIIDGYADWWQALKRGD